MPKIKGGLGIGVSLTIEGRNRLARMQEATGATQASVIEEGLLLLERVKSGESLFELYSAPLKYQMESQNDKAIAKIREAIFAGLNEIFNERLSDLQAYEIANTYMLAEIYRRVTKVDATVENLVSGFVASSQNIVKDMERQRIRKKGRFS